MKQKTYVVTGYIQNKDRPEAWHYSCGIVGTDAEYKNVGDEWKKLAIDQVIPEDLKEIFNAGENIILTSTSKICKFLVFLNKKGCYRPKADFNIKEAREQLRCD